MMPLKNLRGVVRGKTIELDESIPIAEGEIVELTITHSDSNARASGRDPGAGLRNACGAWADDAEALDEFLEWNRQQRKQSRPEVEP